MEAAYAVPAVGKGKKVERESEGGFIEERHVQRIELATASSMERSRQGVEAGG